MPDVLAAGPDFGLGGRWPQVQHMGRAIGSDPFGRGGARADPRLGKLEAGQPLATRRTRGRAKTQVRPSISQESNPSLARALSLTRVLRGWYRYPPNLGPIPPELDTCIWSRISMCLGRIPQVLVYYVIHT